ncbi:unnamed protein product, partial [Mesocestoides corti]|uniref:Secreted protein n=1 Tax=Mesocestoides corti TaxID=53468 RepID=A0A0R3U9K4_MESCO
LNCILIQILNIRHCLLRGDFELSDQPHCGRPRKCKDVKLQALLDEDLAQVQVRHRIQCRNFGISAHTSMIGESLYCVRSPTLDTPAWKSGLEWL